jgi:hypothetical protein
MAYSKYLVTSFWASAFGGRTKNEGSNSGRGASQNVNIEEFGEKETF